MPDTGISKKPLQRSVFVHIEGRVQGVGFRAFIELRARGLGLNGWVRNRRDGGVEATFAGAPNLVQEMIAECHRGPPFARVMFVRVRENFDAVEDGFSVRATV